MRSGSHVQLAALRNRDLELQTTSPFNNHGSMGRSTACFRHKNVLVLLGFQKFPFFCVTLYFCPELQLWTMYYDSSFLLKSPVWRNPRCLSVELSEHPVISLIFAHPVVLAVMSLLMMLIPYVIIAIIRISAGVTCITWCFPFPLLFLFSTIFILLAASHRFIILFWDICSFSQFKGTSFSLVFK